MDWWPPHSARVFVLQLAESHLTQRLVRQIVGRIARLAWQQRRGALHVSLRCTFNGWWCNEEKERLLVELRRESDVKKRKAIVDRVQTIYYEDVDSVKMGDYFTLDVARRELRGDFRTAPRMYFWNAWLAK